ncbi:recombination protein NinB [Burkholderia contaminans]|uniref:recombination protein NinB n=1 Tax=Burkholderia TaxID=32008 RepID=UPI0010F93500|nr:MULTISPECIES: recombination protein NinB [Burkholderia]MBD1412902.1 recombination protein NinB [Burkholderia contaminans]UXZ68649.1 recombination protein NinB [Burkholderia contaminans]UXZ76410.1 recombination protein NinB [Burkholderia contaminans]
MDKQIFTLTPTNRRFVAEVLHNAPDGYVATISEPTRTLEQNSLLWPLLTEVSKQVVWYGKKLTPAEWKDVFTAALRKQTVVPGIDGGFVVCGLSTSTLGKKMFSDLIELIFAFGAEHGVKFAAPKSHYLLAAGAKKI